MKRFGIGQGGGASPDNLPGFSYSLLNRRAAKRKEAGFSNDLVAIIASWDCLRDFSEKIACF